MSFPLSLSFPLLLSFLRKKESIVATDCLFRKNQFAPSVMSLWIPAFAGMTEKTKYCYYE
ncbi:Uncharacterized protein dnm_055750 [Desulfonema magnum]|uniref:Uncharacterized protein n=1 Tax=Desulfonema magnum TaxID=45655 RepID=A0A975GQ53_9BACT|nr:Uncharacterized protein dnm_055750 [Desulfonema magnum]